MRLTYLSAVLSVVAGQIPLLAATRAPSANKGTPVARGVEGAAQALGCSVGMVREMRQPLRRRRRARIGI